MSQRLTLQDAEAKLLSSLSTLIWLIPLIFAAQLYLEYTSPDFEITFSGDEIASILKGLFWVIVFFRFIRALEDQFTKQREHELIKMEKEMKKRKSEYE